MKEIKTTAELLKLDGRKVHYSHCVHGSFNVKISVDGEISVDGDKVFLLHNDAHLDGSICRDLRGYNFSWLLSGTNTLYELTNIELGKSVTLLDQEYTEQDYVYADYSKVKDIPEWWTGKHMYVYYSDESVEDALAQKKIGLCVDYDIQERFWVDENCTPDKELSRNDPDVDSKYYAVPVLKSDLEKQEKIAEVKATIAKLTAELKVLEGTA